MSVEDVVKWIVSLVTLALTTLVGALTGFLFRGVSGNRESVLQHAASIKSLEDRMSNVERRSLTVEDVRKVVEGVMRESEKRQEAMTEKLAKLHDDVLTIKTRCYGPRPSDSGKC